MRGTSVDEGRAALILEGTDHGGRESGPVPRLTEARKPASPSSQRQVARWHRILAVAAELGARTAYEQVQMQEIADAADVSLTTLYRYFPSKVQLFTAVYAARVERFVEEEWPQKNGDAVEIVGERLVALTGRLMAQPLLCRSMVQAASADYADPSRPETPVAESCLYQAILCTFGDDDPGEERITAVRMLVYSWWGVLFSHLSGRTSAAEARYQVLSAARLLLGRDTRHG
ncbi:TetR/AcrR family transcriptional regulator [Streptomyces antibioticus]|uniref:TetR/AcrR family transcriptional regulator n=1 Tax=Streptomyces antibioticus TaxID=1890 RepID=UPI0036778060